MVGLLLDSVIVRVKVVAVGEHTTDRVLGMLGDPGVNVLELNVALDAASDGRT